MNAHIQALRALCAVHQHPAAPFVVRTRFEREMFGLLICIALNRFGSEPSSIDRGRVTAFLDRQSQASNKDVGLLMLEICRIFEKFTYLCDTSNWSNDGQDPRVEACRPDILALCDKIEAVQKLETSDLEAASQGLSRDG